MSISTKKIDKPALIVMAAGMGSRYGGLKQIDPISDEGEIILDFSLYDAMMAGFEEIVFIIKKENEQDFRALIDERSGKHLNIHYAFQDIADIPEGCKIPEGREKPWGTGHAVLAARKLIDAPFAVINADDYYGAGAFQSMYDFLDKAKDDDKYRYSMVGYRLDKTLTENGHVARGICTVDDKNNLVSVVERTKIMRKGDAVAFTEDDGQTWTEVAGDTIVSMNFWGFTPDYFDYSQKAFVRFLEEHIAEPKSEFYIPLMVDTLIKSGEAKVRLLSSTAQWFGVTYQEDRKNVVARLASLAADGTYPSPLF